MKSDEAIQLNTSNNVSYGIEEIVQRWHDRFAFSRPDILERYLDGRLDLQIRLVRSGGRHQGLEQWCLVVRATHEDLVGVDLLTDHRPGHGDFVNLEHMRQHDQKPVFVEIVKAGEDRQGVILRGQVIRSIARLAFVDEIEREIRKTFYFGAVKGLVSFGVREDRKLTSFKNLVDVGGGGHLDQHLRDDVIQTRPEQEQDLSDLHAHPKRDRIQWIEVGDYLAQISIDLMSDRILVQVPEIGTFPFQVDDVLFGPI